jgi:hypothetical protein
MPIQPPVRPNTPGQWRALLQVGLPFLLLIWFDSLALGDGLFISGQIKCTSPSARDKSHF